jgi:hypothetical protein
MHNDNATHYKKFIISRSLKYRHGFGSIGHCTRHLDAASGRALPTTADADGQVAIGVKIEQIVTPTDSFVQVRVSLVAVPQTHAPAGPEAALSSIRELRETKLILNSFLRLHDGTANGQRRRGECLLSPAARWDWRLIAWTARPLFRQR